VVVGLALVGAVFFGWMQRFRPQVLRDEPDAGPAGG
jgi:hypothetical protein